MIFNYVGRKKESKGTVPIVLSSHLGILNDETKIFQLRTNTSGKPLPFYGFDFDNTTADTAETYYRAIKILVRSYGRKVNKTPCLVEFKRGIAPDFYAWGVPTSIPIDHVWVKLAKIVLEIESEKPSRLFPGVAEMLHDTAQDRNHFIITSNSIYPVAEIIKGQAGVDVNVVIVTKKKHRVLDALAKFHHHHHRNNHIPFYYFGDSPSDMSAAVKCEHPVFPVGVGRREMSNARWKSFRQNWREMMIKSGAQGIVDHDSLWKAAYGEFDFEGSVLR